MRCASSRVLCRSSSPRRSPSNSERVVMERYRWGRTARIYTPRRRLKHEVRRARGDAARERRGRVHGVSHVQAWPGGHEELDALLDVVDAVVDRGIALRGDEHDSEGEDVARDGRVADEVVLHARPVRLEHLDRV